MFLNFRSSMCDYPLKINEASKLRQKDVEESEDSDDEIRRIMTQQDGFVIVDAKELEKVRVVKQKRRHSQDDGRSIH